MGITIIEPNKRDQIFAYKIPDFNLNNSQKNEDKIGSKEEDFEILQELGLGKFSQVFKVKSYKDHNIYAMKKVDLEHTGNTVYLENEEKILAKLDHPNIVKCYKVFRDKNNKYLYFIMELMNNGDLDSFTEGFDGFETYPQEKILWKIFYDCLKGLEYIHKEELIHRDIKPKNLFFDENLKIKIGDFNASMALSDNSAIKFSGSNDQNIYKQMLNDNEPVGTTNYQAPEIYGAYDEKVDVYSMGSTFFEICYLKNPNRPDVDKYDYFPKKIYSKELNNLLEGMLERDPDNRLSSFEAKSIAKKYYILKYLKNTSVEAVLRCFYEFPNFNGFFKNLNEKCFNESKEITKKIYFVFKSFGENVKDKIDDSLYNLRSAMGKLGIIIDQKKDNEIDPGTFIINLLSRLNSELNERCGPFKDRTNEEFIKSSKNYRFETGQEETFFNEYLEIYNRRILSLITKNFFSYMITDLKCEKCNNICHCLSQSFFIPFNLEIFSKKMGNNNLSIKSAFDCLVQDYIKIVSKKQIKCKKCKENNQNYTKSFKFYHTAKNLIIILDRGKDYNIDISIDFEETLQLKKDVVQKYTEVNYKLLGLIDKIGDKYISFTRNDNSWISSEGVKLSFEEVKKSGKVIILFYYSKDDNLILQSAISQAQTNNTINNNNPNCNQFSQGNNFYQSNNQNFQNFPNNINNNINNTNSLSYNPNVNINNQVIVNVYNNCPNNQPNNIPNSNFIPNNINNNNTSIYPNTNIPVMPNTNNNQSNIYNSYVPQNNYNNQSTFQPIPKVNNMINTQPNITMRPQIPNYINPNNINNSIYPNMPCINQLNMGNTVSQPLNNIYNNGIPMNMGMPMMNTPYPNNFQYGYYWNGCNNYMGTQPMQPMQPPFK